MGKIITFGEIMLRLAPNGYYRLFQNDQLQATFGGGEANVAVSLANFGMDAAFVSKLPANAIGQGAINTLRGLGVDTTSIIRGGDRIGLDACQAAVKHGVKISCDLNYRSKLWSREQAQKAMTNLCQYVDVCISNEEDSKDVFGITPANTDINGGKLDHTAYESVARQLKDPFGFKLVAFTLRASHSASDNDWAGMLYDGSHCYFSNKYHLHIVDRVGGGDSFAAGLIYALLDHRSPQDIIEFAAAASALKHSVEGDFNRVTLAEVEKLACGDGSGRVQR